MLDVSGSYYPAAIYLGGSGQTVVRAFDSEVVQLFGFAESSSEETIVGIGSTVIPPGVAESLGGLASLIVEIEPAAA